MTCPQCHKELPEDQKGKRCPFCGLLAMRFNWPLFLCGLLLPPILTLIAAVPAIARMTEDVSPMVGVLGSVGGGIICGVAYAFGSTDSVPGRVILGVFASGVMFVVCLMLCLFGCAIGNLAL